MPVQALVTQPHGVSAAGWNCGAAGFRPTCARGEIKPSGPATERSVEIVQAQVDAALDVGAIVGDDFGPGTGKIGDGDLSESKVHVLDAGAVTAHVERIKIVDLDVLATVKPLAGPDLGVRLALEKIAGTNEGLSQTKLVVGARVVEIGIAGGVGGVGLDQSLRPEPCLVGIVFGVQPVVDENQLTVCLGFVAEPVLCPGPGSL